MSVDHESNAVVCSFAVVEIEVSIRAVLCSTTEVARSLQGEHDLVSPMLPRVLTHRNRRSRSNIE